MNLIHLHRIANFLHRKRIPLLPKLLYYIQFLMFNSSLPASTQIGKKSTFAYGGIGVVVHARAIIGEGCVIGQGITIGGRSKKVEVPKIGNNVYLGAGCRILGDIVIGDEVVIGPNSVVLTDVPSGSIVVGVPGKIVKTGIVMRDFV
ncbi:serine O-acetyltransferase [Mucilaginibacter lutimaris]|uniref:Serine O-acetyltransferase n=2 Tax=Mucilaginibacter lutimaris TaxID=931629 RepID=A0ABW2ZC63_9SPHI